jgi:hypothetical protein
VAGPTTPVSSGQLFRYVTLAAFTAGEALQSGTVGINVGITEHAPSAGPLP